MEILVTIGTILGVITGLVTVFSWILHIKKYDIRKMKFTKWLRKIFRSREEPDIYELTPNNFKKPKD